MTSQQTQWMRNIKVERDKMKSMKTVIRIDEENDTIDFVAKGAGDELGMIGYKFDEEQYNNIMNCYK